MSFNKIILIGNLGKDPELRYTTTGLAVCTFTLATNEKRKDNKGEMQEVVTWFKVTCWRQQAENVSRYLAKGSKIYVEGKLRLEEWTDRDNNTRYTLDVQATEIQFLSTNSLANQGYDPTPNPSGAEEALTHSGPAPVQPANGDDDIPF